MSVAMNSTESKPDLSPSIGIEATPDADEGHVIEQMEKAVRGHLRHYSQEKYTQPGHPPEFERWAELDAGFKLRVDCTESAIPAPDSMGGVNVDTPYYTDLRFSRLSVEPVGDRVVATFRVEVA